VYKLRMDTHALLEVSIHLCVFPTPYNIAVHHLPTDAADEPNEYNNCSVSYTDIVFENLVEMDYLRKFIKNGEFW